ncbi:MAG: peptidase MA family metallohydrolase [Pseudomonadota bacterium]
MIVRHDPSDSGPARALKLKAEALLARLEGEYGFPSLGPLTIILASSNDAYFRAQPRGWRAPDWSAAAAYPELGLIVMKSRNVLPTAELDEILAHEIFHILLGKLFGRAPVPRWLEEGLAMHLSGEGGLSRRTDLARALIAGRLIPLRELVDRFPEDSFGAETAYAESFYLVAFLRDEFGPQALGTVLKSLSLGASPETALFHATRRPPQRLERDFSDWLRRRFSLFLLLDQPGIMWAAAALVLAGAMAWKRRAIKRKLAEWEAEENDAAGDSERPGGPSGPAGSDDTL